MPGRQEPKKDVANNETASGSCKRASIRGCPNGGTRMAKSHALDAEFIGIQGHTRGTETSKYPEEKKTRVIPLVAASECGGA